MLLQASLLPSIGRYSVIAARYNYNDSMKSLLDLHPLSMSSVFLLLPSCATIELKKKGKKKNRERTFTCLHAGLKKSMPKSHFHSTWNEDFYRVTDRFVKKPPTSFFFHQQFCIIRLCESITVCPTLLYTRRNRVTYSLLSFDSY